MAPGPNGWRIRAPLIDLNERKISGGMRREWQRAALAALAGATAAVCAIALGVAIGSALWGAAIVMGG